MADPNDVLLDATTALIPPLLTGLEALAYVGRHLHPPHLAGLVDAIDGFDARIEAGKQTFDAAPWPEQLAFFRDQLSEAAESALKAMQGLRASVGDANGMLKAYRSMRHSTRAVEALYPMSFSLPAINRFFIDVERREDAELFARRSVARRRRDHECQQCGGRTRRFFAVRARVLRPG